WTRPWPAGSPPAGASRAGGRRHRRRAAREARPAPDHCALGPAAVAPPANRGERGPARWYGRQGTRARPGGHVKIGIGLPNTVPGTPGDLLLEWARRAEAAGFSGLATIDRVVYPSYDTLATLAAAAGATNRIELVSNILLAPLHSPVMLAKSAASIDQLS